MKHRAHFITAALVAVLILPVLAQARPQSHRLNEDAALALLVRTLERDNVYKHRISPDCVTYGTEETTSAYFEFVLREKHDAKCGGDPETNPVVDRYRVYRRSGKIERWEPTEDSWHRYNRQKPDSAGIKSIRRPTF
jgi:hypothetical protein